GLAQDEGRLQHRAVADLDAGIDLDARNGLFRTACALGSSAPDRLDHVDRVLHDARAHESVPRDAAIAPLTRAGSPAGRRWPSPFSVLSCTPAPSSTPGATLVPAW